MESPRKPIRIEFNSEKNYNYARNLLLRDMRSDKVIKEKPEEKAMYIDSIQMGLLNIAGADYKKVV